MKKYSFILFILLLLVGCSSRSSNKIPPNIAKLKNLTVIPADVKPEHQISLKKDKVYGSTTNVLIGRMGPVAVDDSGRVFIAAEQKGTIDVFAPDGRYITHFGRRGKGPGEFRGIRNLHIRNRKLFIGTGLGYSIYSLDSLKFMYTVNLADNQHDIKSLSGTNLRHNLVGYDGKYIAEFTSDSVEGKSDWDKMEVNGRLYRLDKNGDVVPGKLMNIVDQVDVMVPFKGGATDQQGNYTRIPRVGVPPGFYGKTLLAISDGNQILRAWSVNFLIKVYKPDGTYEKAIYVPYTKIPLTHENAVQAGIHDYIMRGWKSIKRPKNWPTLNDMKIDNQNRLWVSTIVKNMKVYQWWVLSQNGKLLARFNWPRNKPIRVIKNGYLYTQETDTSTGISKIMRYKIKLE